MRISSTAVVLSFQFLTAFTSSVEASPNVRRVLNIEETSAELEANAHEIVSSVTVHTRANPVMEVRNRALSTIDAPEEHVRALSTANTCPNFATVNGNFVSSYCSLNEDCECTGEYSVKEDLNGQGCYHCSKPDGASCVDGHECLTRVSECKYGICGPTQCPNTSTVNGSTTINSCSYNVCECSGEYGVKEDLNGQGCFHCSKPDGSTCVEDYECIAASNCNGGVCGAVQCPSSASVQGSTTISNCSYNDCECSGDYSLKEDLTGQGCYHCSKPNDAECTKDDECMYRASKCYDGKCGARRCPAINSGYCTLDDSCVCEDPLYPNSYVHTFSNGVSCFACTA